MFSIFYFWSWIFKTTSKFWSAPCKKASNPPACSVHGLHKMLSSYWLAHFHLMKKSAKVQLYFGSGCGMMKVFTCEPQSKEQLMPLPHLWNTVWRKKDRSLSTYNPWTEQAGDWVQFCMKRLRTLKLFQIFSTEIKKSKTYSGWCPFKGLSNGTNLIKIQSGRTVPLTSRHGIVKVRSLGYLKVYTIIHTF